MIPRDLFSELRAMDRHELRRIAIFVRGLLMAMEDELAWAEEGVTYRLERVRCGKQGCKSCPHGPYWYAYYREGDRLRSRYIGRHLAGRVGLVSESSGSGESR
jgi:hypothetical protein